MRQIADNKGGVRTIIPRSEPNTKRRTQAEFKVSRNQRKKKRNVLVLSQGPEIAFSETGTESDVLSASPSAEENLHTKAHHPETVYLAGNQLVDRSPANVSALHLRHRRLNTVYGNLPEAIICLRQN